MPKLKLYTKSYCPYCDQAKMILESAQITDYEEISIDGNELKMRKELFEMTGGRWDVPQVFVEDKYIGDDDDLARLAQTGELDQLLA
jgi:glutaredoxin 3